MAAQVLFGCDKAIGMAKAKSFDRKKQSWFSWLMGAPLSRGRYPANCQTQLHINCHCDRCCCAAFVVFVSLQTQEMCMDV
jgi:hypothetical protein